MTLLALVRRFGRSRSGGVAAIVGLGMPVFVGAMAIAIDAGIWYAHSRQNQDAADAVAFSAGVNYGYTGDKTYATNTAKAIAAAYGVANGSNGGSGAITWTINYTPTAAPTKVEAIINRPENLFFSRVFMSSAGTAGKAGAAPGALNQYCILALNTSTTSTLMNPSDTNGTTLLIDDGGSMTVPNCGIAVNGAGSGDFNIGSSTVSALKVSVAGNDTSYLISGKGGSLTTTAAPSPDVLTSQAPFADPYKSTPSPTGLTCNYTNWSSTSTGNLTLSPGTYCGGIAFYDAATVTMQSGTYYIDGGYFSTKGGSVTGNNVTIVLTGDSTHSNAEIEITQGTTLTLTAPTSGTYSGLAIYADPVAHDGGPQAGTYQPDSAFGNPGSATLNIQGALYFPKQFIEIANGVSFTSSICTQIIAFEIYFQEGASFNNSCTVGGAGQASIGSATKLVE